MVEDWLFVSLIPFWGSGVAVQKESSNKYFNHMAKQFEVNVEGYKISLLSMSNQKVECWLSEAAKESSGVFDKFWLLYSKES